jgi:hypothetical protein
MYPGVPPLSPLSPLSLAATPCSDAPPTVSEFPEAAPPEFELVFDTNKGDIDIDLGNVDTAAGLDRGREMGEGMVRYEMDRSMVGEEGTRWRLYGSKRSSKLTAKRICYELWLQGLNKVIGSKRLTYFSVCPCALCSLVTYTSVE